MGIEIPDPVYGANCILCWPAGLTPKFFWASFTGIKQGALWLPAHGTPRNEIIKLHQWSLQSCTWLDQTPVPSCEFIPGGGQGDVRMHRVALSRQFESKAGNPCDMWFENRFTVPAGNRFYGGLCQLMTANEGASLSLADVQELINMEIDPDTLSDFWPIAAGEKVVRFARKQDMTRIFLRLDDTT